MKVSILRKSGALIAAVAASMLALAPALQAEEVRPGIFAVATGETVRIERHGICRMIRNDGSRRIHIPVGSAEEWGARAEPQLNWRSFLLNVDRMDNVRVFGCGVSYVPSSSYALWCAYGGGGEAQMCADGVHMLRTNAAAAGRNVVDIQSLPPFYPGFTVPNGSPADIASKATLSCEAVSSPGVYWFMNWGGGGGPIYAWIFECA